ncbi:cupin domain-containing protein [Aeromicrobium endophyticum]|uniref:Cupin domain-containing protein n=1 Tax=Aeromicrobium endophyticum TaxID=2292704 RepID=A0A371PEP9_9ACTN|nr:cupin domain-containing protein [Aeromicrobium endophyticum]REK73978.1 cupin domain-containing protein [Aeromicrobium endophyticum]
MTSQPRNITAALASFDERWQPRSLAVVNDTEIRLAKAEGDYVWHRHPDSDEFFVVLEGHLRIDLRDEDGQRRVELSALDSYLVPRGVEHRPSSSHGASIITVDRTGTATTGDFAGTVPDHITSLTSGLPLG